MRFELERSGAHFLHVFDFPTHFKAEMDQIRLELAPVVRSLPSWLIVQEGNGKTLQANVRLVYRRKAVSVHGSDRMIAALDKARRMRAGAAIKVRMVIVSHLRCVLDEVEGSAAHLLTTALPPRPDDNLRR